MTSSDSHRLEKSMMVLIISIDYTETLHVTSACVRLESTCRSGMKQALYLQCCHIWWRAIDSCECCILALTPRDNSKRPDSLDLNMMVLRLLWMFVVRYTNLTGHSDCEPDAEGQFCECLISAATKAKELYKQSILLFRHQGSDCWLNLSFNSTGPHLCRGKKGLHEKKVVWAL